MFLDLVKWIQIQKWVNKVLFKSKQRPERPPDFSTALKEAKVDLDLNLSCALAQTLPGRALRYVQPEDLMVCATEHVKFFLCILLTIPVTYLIKTWGIGN